MNPSATTALVWFRRDLRDFDHAALAQALRRHARVFCVFVFDTEILEPLRQRGLVTDRRVDFILHAVRELDAALRARGGGLLVRHGQAIEEIPRLAAELAVAGVFANHDHEPAACRRDETVAASLARDGRAFHSFKDQVIFECDEVLTKTGTTFSVFTPYARAWRSRLAPGDLAAHDCTAQPGQLAVPHAGHFIPPAPTYFTLEQLGFAPTDLPRLKMPCGMSGGAALFDDFLTRLDRYHEQRDFPAIKGTSGLSPHLRFGTVSIRQLAAAAHAHSLQPGGRGAEVWLNELIWRDFYQMILWHRPDVVGHAFKPTYDALAWDDAPGLFAAWQTGHTGYPLVDAAQRQLLQSGWMHNRLRMVTASFLTKDLGIDWKLGEQHFADWLLDYDLASNNGGWQWAASTGCDAQPWFRIFNPVTQSERFDPQGTFIRRYVPELETVPDKFIHAPWRMAEKAPPGYPPPVVDHAVARERTLARYGVLKVRPI
jgi:deoxyribodipyrimidine photo-lyase